MKKTQYSVSFMSGINVGILDIAMRYNANVYHVHYYIQQLKFTIK
jgi:hypothetical protein